MWVSLGIFINNRDQTTRQTTDQKIYCRLFSRLFSPRFWRGWYSGGLTLTKELYRGGGFQGKNTARNRLQGDREFRGAACFSRAHLVHFWNRSCPHCLVVHSTKMHHGHGKTVSHTFGALQHCPILASSASGRTFVRLCFQKKIVSLFTKILTKHTMHK